ncbi:hypothetical protein F2Q69_00011533 [Brassica cretica]|uniref:Uncharacterized protein n=1 Tax=Brassica cretica TaxID=69181 RepID=A0A8S9R0I0_BRACR|nr:hypothetical protein F2Q69_00011533 [Brassica cretica]
MTRVDLNVLSSFAADMESDPSVTINSLKPLSFRHRDGSTQYKLRCHRQNESKQLLDKLCASGGEVCRVWLVPDSDTTFFCQLNSLISSDRLIFSFRDATSFSPAARIMDEHENARNRSVVVQSTVDLAFETEGMVECNYDATSKITGGWILRGHLGVALRGKHDWL